MRTNTSAQYLRHLADDVLPQVLYVQRHPEDARGIERVLQFRERVSAEFERLVRESETPSPAYWSTKQPSRRWRETAIGRSVFSASCGQ